MHVRRFATYDFFGPKHNASYTEVIYIYIYIYISNTRSAVSRDSRHFESPSPPPRPSKFSLSARAVMDIYTYSIYAHWFPSGISCLHATVTYVCGGLITLYTGDGFLYFIHLLSCACGVMYTARSIPMGVCARGAYIILCVHCGKRVDYRNPVARD